MAKSLVSILLAAAEADDFEQAGGSGASVVVADLTTGTGPIARRRERTAAWLRASRDRQNRPHLFVRIHDLASGSADDDLDALFPAAPDGIMLPACRSGADLQRLGARLAVREAVHSLADGGIGILAEGASSAAAVLAMGSFAGASRRLVGLTWDRDALARDLGLSSAAKDREEPAPLAQARGLSVLAARSAGVPAIDSACAHLGEALVLDCARGRRDGFSGKMTYLPGQVPIIAAAFGGS